MSQVCYRQGDVFLIPTRAIPNQKARKSHGVIVAYGEATGHAHRISDPTRAEVCTVEDQMYLDVQAEDAELIHDEHATITLPKGLYTVRIQREYTPQGIQRVYD
jgi:hypothetical protein